MINDKELLAMIRDPKTQREGFAVLVSQYSEPLYWKVRHIVLDHDDADDVLQNAFVKAWTNLDSFQGKSSLSTWLYRIAVNEALDFLRRKKQMVNVALAENLAEREGDGAWVDTCRSYLIDKRRELMEIVLIDQHHLQVCLAEVFCQTKTPESTTYDNNSLQLISLDINAHNYCCFYILITYIC